MPKTRKPYPPEFLEQLVALVRAGRTPKDLVREFEGFYAWARRPLSARAVKDIGLTALIHAIHRRSDGAYGAPSIHAELADEHDHRVGKKRVARLMRAAVLRGLHPRRFVTTTVSDPAADRAVDQVDRQFVAEGPDRLWVADITYIPTWAGFLYLAVVLDVWSRRIVGCRHLPRLRDTLKRELKIDTTTSKKKAA